MPLLTQYNQREVIHQCYVRSVRAGAPPIDGETTGWVYDPRLVCVQITSQTGPSGGSANFLVKPLQPSTPDASPDSPAAEELARHYSTDDQVRVIVLPYADEAQGGGVTVLFEGVLDRQSLRITSQEGGQDEGVQLVARPMPAAIDNDSPEHVIRGRWISDLRTNDRPTAIGPEEDVYVVESPAIPAIFNFRGRPNKHHAILVKCGEGDKEIEAAVFSHDDDRAGQYWTFGDAVAALVAVWGVGPQDAPLSRNFDIDEDLLAALQDPGAVEEDGIYKGFSTILPEISVHGLGLFDALSKLCQAAGFDFSLTIAKPADGPAVDSDLPGVPADSEVDPEDEPTEPKYDRRYVLRLWAKGRGPVEWFDLSKRGSSPTSAEQLSSENNLSQLAVVRDGREIVNVVYGAGREFFECRVPLLPLWNPVEMSESAPDPIDMQPIEEDLNEPGTYASRHVVGGSNFEFTGHVGRLWGLDCKGGGTYYTSGLYQQPPDGVDWDFVLDFNDSASAMVAARTAEKITDKMRWTKRVRPLLKLRSPDARAASVEYILECSEDAGETWATVPDRLRYSVLRDGVCGIKLTVNNLCAVNLASLRSGEPVEDVEASWWNLIRLRQLTFRILCSIEADHAWRIDAERQPASGTAYQRAQVVVYPVDRTWVQPQTAYNETAEWTQVLGWSDSTAVDGQDPDLKALVEGRREWLQSLRSTGRGDLWCLEFDRYAPGTRIAGVRGRGLDFSLGGGEEKQYPNIVAVTWTLTPGNQQTTQLTLDDDAYAPATVGGRLTGGARG